MSEKEKQVAEFYNASPTAKFWESIHKRHMHVGYWDDTNPNDNLFEASLKFTKLLVEWVGAEIKEGQRFIDLGCGFGLPGCRLVEATGCQLDGITLSTYQAEEANKYAEEEGFKDKAKFQVANALQLPFQDNTFDGCWFLESIFHIGHEAALTEVYRVLKPESYIYIADFIKLESMKAEDEQLLKDHLALSTLFEANDYPGLLKNTGFKLFEIRDVTREVRRREKECYADEFKRRKNFLISQLGESGYNDFKNLADEWVRIRTTTLGYCVIKAKVIK